MSDHAEQQLAARLVEADRVWRRIMRWRRIGTAAFTTALVVAAFGIAMAIVGEVAINIIALAPLIAANAVMGVANRRTRALTTRLAELIGPLD